MRQVTRMTEFPVFQRVLGTIKVLRLWWLVGHILPGIEHECAHMGAQITNGTVEQAFKLHFAGP